MGGATYRHKNAICILCLFSLCCSFIATNTLDVVESIGMIGLVVSDVKFAHDEERVPEGLVWVNVLRVVPGSHRVIVLYYRASP